MQGKETEPLRSATALSATDNLRWHVPLCATEHLDFLMRSKSRTDVLLLVQQQIVELQVLMSHRGSTPKQNLKADSDCLVVFNLRKAIDAQRDLVFLIN
jgi:hypothetical protein